METTKINQIVSLLLVIALLIFGIAATVAAIEPSQPGSIQNVSNTTTSYPNGSVLNKTRGYIYFVNFSEQAPTQKWLGYVGQVKGEYGLEDASGNALYDWDIVTVTGELYATKEGAAFGSTGESQFDNVNPHGGGVPLWSNLSCAVYDQLVKENNNFNHNDTWDNTTAEDAYINTFETTTFDLATFYAGERRVTDTTMFNSTGTQQCYGINLKGANGADNTTNWHEVVLTDGTAQQEWNDGSSGYTYDLIYTVMLENNTIGFNGNVYDFEILLPQEGREGYQENIAYYFYIELV